MENALDYIITIMLYDNIDVAERNLKRVIYLCEKTLYLFLLSLLTLYSYSKISYSVLIGLATAVLVATSCVCCGLYAYVAHLERRFIEDEII